MSIEQRFGRIVNPNLLHNWYLADPVNQRNVMVLPLEAYGIDRWLDMIGSDVNAAVMDDYIFLPAQHVLSQRMEPGKVRYGQVYTASVLTLEGQLYSGTHVYTVPDQPFDFINNSDVHLYFYGENLFQIRANSDLNVVAVKLEPGPFQTLAHKEGNKWVLNKTPDYALELLRCQRYFVRMVIPSWSRIGYGAANTGNFTINIPLPVAMRTNPAVIFSDATWKTDPKDVAITQLDSFGGLSGNEAQVLVYTNSEASGEFVRLRNFTDSAAYIDFSADL